MAAPVYATPSQLAATGQPVPCDAERLLEDASRELDGYLITALYAVDGNGAPTDPDVAAAFRTAVCAIVKYRGPDAEDEGAWTTVTAGPVSMSRPAPDPVRTGDALPLAAVRALRALPFAKFSLGRPWNGTGW